MVVNERDGPVGVGWMLGRTSRFAYDLEGNLVRVTYPGGAFETFEYDERTS